MPSKGVDVYGFLGVNWPKTVPCYSYRSKVKTRTVTTYGWWSDHFELDLKDQKGWIEAIEMDVHGSLDAVAQNLFSRINYINTVTGFLEEGSSITNLSQMASQIVGLPDGSECIITFGFYEAGKGEVGLPSSDRFWLTLTPAYDEWMGHVAPSGGTSAAQSFNTLVLSSAHDSGMNSSANVMTLLRKGLNVAKIMSSLLGAFPVFKGDLGGITGPILAKFAENIIVALSMTQKDSLTTMLRIGARYFEFRPAHISSYFDNPSALPDKLYYAHWAIPGQSFDSWLAEAVSFLRAKPTEIVVVQIRRDGVDSSCKFATDAEVDSYVEAALLNSGVVRGGLDDMELSIDELRATQKRLIVLNEVGQYSTYGGNNSTLDGHSIVKEFGTFLADATNGEKDDKIAVWQCQATSTNIRDVAIHCAIFAKGTTSSLLCTKPACDSVTLPWLAANVYPTMPTTILQVIMNDFFDGYTSQVAIDLSQKYLQKAVMDRSGGTPRPN